MSEQRGVIGAREFLDMSRAEGKEALGITSDRAYDRAYRELSEAQSANERRGEPASVVIKKKGTRVIHG